jgi:TRAP-type mannitol/chloroaromatic compound transport system permease small subunit
MRVIDATNRRVGRAMVWPILGAVLVSAGNAISRKAFDLSSNAMLELQWYLFGLAFLGAAGYVLLVDEHVRIDAVARRFTARTRATIDIFVLLACVLPMVVLLGSMGWTLTAQAWTSGEVSSNAGGLPRWPAYACIPLGMALLGLQAVAETVRRGAWIAGRVQSPTLSEEAMPPLIGPRESAS